MTARRSDATPEAPVKPRSGKAASSSDNATGIAPKARGRKAGMGQGEDGHGEVDPNDTGKGRTPQLTRERIVRAAYQLAKIDPLNALSMRKIASRLKVTPMAIYKHFSDKSELTAAVIDMQMNDSNLIPDDIDEADWREWIRTSFTRMREAYDNAPGMLQYMPQATSFGPAVLHWQNETLKILIKAGLTPKQALTAHAAMAQLATGSAILVPIRRQGMERVFPSIWKDLQEGKVPSLIDVTVSGMSPVDFPYVVMAGATMLEDMQDSRKAFQNELELILDSLEVQIRNNR